MRDRPWYYRLPLEPQYDVALLSPNFETREAARLENERRITLLRRGADEASQDLADKLEECHGRSPCGSAACRLCMREFRRAVTGLALKRFEE